MKLLSSTLFRSQAHQGRSGAERGVALIITLILLSVITFMAVTFLVVSRAQKGAVSTSTDLAIAREAANAAADRAKAELAASIIAFTNAANFDLLVSTNFINPLGFIPGNRSFTNVAYAGPNGRPLTAQELQESLSHLLYNPRVPVFVITNPAFPTSNDFRYYHDLNRNRRYDTNGWGPVIGPRGVFYNTNHNPISSIQPGNTLSNFFVGDPEWIGRLERADLPHSASNHFIYRYAYLVVPAGKALDLNYIHNSAAGDDTVNPADPHHFMRNQGVGSWEMNLAALLTDLNTNLWPYPKDTPNGIAYDYSINTNNNLPTYKGVSFEDATSLLEYRYGGSRANLPRIDALFTLKGVWSFQHDFVDGYTRGPLLTDNSRTFAVDPDSLANFPWSGADNTNHFFTTQELFDRSKTAMSVPKILPSFSERLQMAGTNTDSYNRYTFYRMLAALGTDSAWETPRDKINLNYDNLVQGITDPVTKQVLRAATNFIPWHPIDFFTNAANRLLANAGYNPTNLNINYIQVYPTNFYTPSVHQLLQLAANIYDATTNRFLAVQPVLPAPPSVFRPLFRSTNGVVYVAGYTEVTNAAQMLDPAIRWHDMYNRADMNNLRGPDMVYGVPLVVGAKKGLPNFNEMNMDTIIQVTRKLEFRRPSLNADVNQTNVMYTLSISNIVGCEAWNSYSNAYARPLQVRVAVDMFATITNEFNELLLAITNPPIQRSALMNVAASNWPGYVNPSFAQASFKVPLVPAGSNAFYFLSNSVYMEAPRRFAPLIGQPFVQNSQFPSPRWWLSLRTRLRFILVDTGFTPARILDYVNLDASEPPLDIAAILTMDANCNALPDPNANEGSMWCTNRIGGGNSIARPTYGIINQINASLGNIDPPRWNSDPLMLDKPAAIDFFRAQFKGFSPKTYPQGFFSRSNVFYSPYVAMRTIYFNTPWQANDPLVHYTIGDLTDFFKNFQTNRIAFEKDLRTNNIGAINTRFEPWGGNPVSGSSSPTVKEVAVKDPMVTRSDDWDFPTNKLASIGQLGRVHRGTPWQTIYMKSAMPTNLLVWQKWSGNGVFARNVGQFQTNIIPYNFIFPDAALTQPTNDWYVLDLFTTALNENATRGQMAVNQTNLAAWSALLAGVNVMPNSRSNMFITPAGNYNPAFPPPLVSIVAGVQRAMTNYPGHTFHRLGEILATPELTVRSPFLKSSGGPLALDMNEAVYERIPQQVLGLMKGVDDPRFVIYAYGQALKPADKSLVTAAGPYFKLCTNYQVTAESATRTVIRFEGMPAYPHPPGIQTRLNNLRAVVESFNVLPPD